MATVTATHVIEFADGTVLRSSCKYNTISRQISDKELTELTETIEEPAGGAKAVRETIELGTGEVIDLFDENADSE